MNKKKVTGVAFMITAEGMRVNFNYSVIDENGNVLDRNVRKNFIAYDKDCLKATQTIIDYIEKNKLD